MSIHLRLRGRNEALCGYVGKTYVEVEAAHAANVQVSCANCKAQLAAKHDANGVPTNIDSDEVKRVARAMREHGGGFVSKLGEALEAADNMNAATVKRAFPAYWETYSDARWQQ